MVFRMGVLIKVGVVAIIDVGEPEYTGIRILVRVNIVGIESKIAPR